MSFFGKAGKVAAKVYTVASRIVNDPVLGPLVKTLPYASSVIGIAGMIRGDVQTVEALHATQGLEHTGPQKFAYVASKFEDGLSIWRASAMQRGKDVVYDPALLTKAIEAEHAAMEASAALLASVDEVEAKDQ